MTSSERGRSPLPPSRGGDAASAAAASLRHGWTRETRASVPPQVMTKFGDARARPTVIRSYNPSSGWGDQYKKTRVTFGVVADLIDLGATLVDLKWKSSHFQFTLGRLVPPA